MSVFRGDDKEIDFEEEDTRNQYPDLYETEEEEKRKEEKEMNIYAKEGTKVEFIEDSFYGSERDREEALKAGLKFNTLYTIAYTEVHDWHTDVYLKEFPEDCFNSVMFKEKE